MDICMPTECVCPCCIDSMLALGLDPEKNEDLLVHKDMVFKKYVNRINSTVAKYDPDMPVIHNCGNIPRNNRDHVFINTKHLELESLPTGGWGYDHFPLSAAYARTLGREFVGMTGKFHKCWGEFGGYKHPNALKYETALSLALGAKCSIGDQLHPLGRFDTATYKLIGAAYSEVKKKEAWCIGAKHFADIGSAAYLMYLKGNVIEADADVRVMANCEKSYFNRSLRCFCSQANTPNKPGDDTPGAVISGNIGYISWPVFTDYGENGAYHTKRLVYDMIDELLRDNKTLEASLPSSGVVTLTEQEAENRLVCHLLYVVTKVRGKNTEIIEDAVPIYNTALKIRTDKFPKRVYSAPDMSDIGYTYENGVLEFTVKEFTIHSMVVIDY